jgi:hypothetical protein
MQNQYWEKLTNKLQNEIFLKKSTSECNENIAPYLNLYASAY